MNLAKQYVAAFNAGQAPNIESAWAYICISESKKAISLAREQFKNVLETKLTLPCSLFDLERDFKEAKHEALRVYKLRAISDSDLSAGERSVKDECRKIFEQVKANND